MKNKQLLLSLLMLVGFSVISWAQTASGPHIDSNKPGMERTVFSPGLVSLDDRHEFGSVFSPDGSEFYWAYVEKGKNTIMGMRYENGSWTAPDTVLTDQYHGFNDPFLSNDGNRLYYISNYRTEEDTVRSDIDIWYSERMADGKSWSAPINAGPNINSVKNEYYISFNQEGTMYFATNFYNERSGNFDIYKSEYRNGKFQKAEKLGPAVNTGAYEADVFIAPDESYIIFAAGRRSNIGQGDLYISFKVNGEWTKSKNMGPAVNTEGHELCPYVTPDGKYLMYTSKQDIVWVDASIIDSLR